LILIFDDASKNFPLFSSKTNYFPSTQIKAEQKRKFTTINSSFPAFVFQTVEHFNKFCPFRSTKNGNQRHPQQFNIFQLTGRLFVVFKSACLFVFFSERSLQRPK